MTWPYPAPDDDAGAAHLVSGTAVPDIALPSTSGNAVNLATLPGRSIVFVYPWTGRPGLPNPPDWDEIPGAHGSTPEAEGFRDVYSEFQSRHIRVLGLSSQASDHHAELASRLKLPFELLSDAEFQFAGVLRLPSFETGGVAYLKRLTLVLDAGWVRKVFYPVHPPDTHAAEVSAYITSSSTSLTENPSLSSPSSK